MTHGPLLPAEEPEKPERPSYIGIHSLDNETDILFVSSGCGQGVGWNSSHVMTMRARDFVVGEYDPGDYARVYQKAIKSGDADEEDDEDDASAYQMYVYLKTATGVPVLTRVTSFKCDNCVVYIGVAYPEVPYRGHQELEVQQLDGAMQRLNISRNNVISAAMAKRGSDNAPATSRTPLGYAKGKTTKAAIILEHPDSTQLETEETGRRPAGPHIVFVTGSIAKFIDADPSDLHNFPFLKLVAPEDLTHTSEFFDRLADSSDVLFETFALLQRPPVIEGDIIVDDKDNMRIIVECLGASVTDGVALMLRRLRVAPPPKRDSVGNYIHSKVHELDDKGGYVSLEELISSDCVTTDVGEFWSELR
ncbi:hypothetical protein IWW51_005178 [Coemansia sp. RSA 2702]|nr:hypothetical protein IWW52_005680 [Coemansia sp. RSA 2704]KAJ2312356.1 hypothetical protein IWW54_002136 [Coemansia sp. RSA 2705]KAJ2318159.1 hypothetical protein IWW51_005178 [Coemansia sp. RSA 2702]